MLSPHLPGFPRIQRRQQRSYRTYVNRYALPDLNIGKLSLRQGSLGKEKKM